MERFDSAFPRSDSIFVLIADHDPLFPATLSLYMIIYVDRIYAIVSKLWLFDKRRTLPTRLYLVAEKSVHVYESRNVQWTKVGPSRNRTSQFSDPETRGKI